MLKILMLFLEKKVYKQYCKYLGWAMIMTIEL